MLGQIVPEPRALLQTSLEVDSIKGATWVLKLDKEDKFIHTKNHLSWSFAHFAQRPCGLLGAQSQPPC